MAIKVLQAGLATTVQDAGRTGYYHLGIPLSGALDQYSFRAANLLLGNPEDAAALEMTMLGPKLEFTQDALIALTGANLPAKLDGVDIANYEVVAVKAGSVLSFGYLRKALEPCRLGWPRCKLRCSISPTHRRNIAKPSRKRCKIKGLGSN